MCDVCDNRMTPQSLCNQQPLLDTTAGGQRNLLQHSSQGPRAKQRVFPKVAPFPLSCSLSACPQPTWHASRRLPQHTTRPLSAKKPRPTVNLSGVCKGAQFCVGFRRSPFAPVHPRARKIHKSPPQGSQENKMRDKLCEGKGNVIVIVRGTNQLNNKHVKRSKSFYL